MTVRYLLGLGAALLAAPALAGPIMDYEYLPTPQDLGDLDHHKVVFWGLEPGLAAGEQVIAASLEFKNLRNWDNNPNDLHVHLLDGAALGVTTLNDNQGGGDYFTNTYADPHTHLVTYSNLTTTAETRVYEFTADEVAALNGYLADGVLGLGFDPDCHYYNQYVKLTLTVPEPASIAMIAVGLLTLVRRR